MKRFPRNKLYFPTKSVLQGIGLLASSAVFEGPALEEFERSFAVYLGVKHAVAVGSGKQALWLCLQALGLKQGARIIVPDFNVPEVPALIAAVGMSPVIVDVDPGTWNLDLRSVDAHLAQGAQCVVATHMFGVPVEMEALVARARRWGAVVIEDACQAVGASVGGRRAGTWGDVGFFSFGSLKIMSTLNGGMIVTDNDRTAGFLREAISRCVFPGRGVLLQELFKTALIKVCTSRGFFDGAVFPALKLIDAFNADFKGSIFQGREITRLDRASVEGLCRRFCQLQATLGLGILPSLDSTLGALLEKASYFTDALTGAGIPVQRVSPGARPSYFKYAVRVPDRERVIAALFRQGIDTTFGYMRACSLLQDLSIYSAGCPASARLDAEHLYLPIHSCDSDKDMDHIIGALVRALK